MIKPFPRKTELRTSSLVLLFALFISVGSCAGGLPSSLVILDPVFPVIAPDAAAVISRQGRKTSILPYEASETLYSILAVEAPAVVFLSPLLAPELDRILDSSPDTKVVYIGGSATTPREGLYSARFSAIAAAELAGTVLADQARSLPEDALSAGIFMTGSEEAAEGFIASYLAGKKENKPIIEYVTTPWSVATANRLKSLDIRQAYIAIQGKDAARWAREVFSNSAYVLLESGLGSLGDPSVDALIVWDLENSLEALVMVLDTAKSASLGGTWKLLGR